MDGLFPPRPFLGSFLTRIALVWIFLRGVTTVGASIETGVASSAGVTGPLLPALLIVPVVVAVLYVDMSRRSELIFLSNLGRSFRGMAVSVVTTCLLLEALLRAIVG